MRLGEKWGYEKSGAGANGSGGHRHTTPPLHLLHVMPQRQHQRRVGRENGKTVLAGEECEG